MTNPNDTEKHIPETTPDAQLGLITATAEGLSDMPDGDRAAEAAGKVINDQLEMTALQRAYSAFTLLNHHSASGFITRHWHEDATASPYSLIDVLYEQVVSDLTEQALTEDYSGLPLEYTESQPSTLSPYPNPRDTFDSLRNDLGWDPSQDDLDDVLGDFMETYKEWPDIVVVQHLLYLIEANDVDWRKSGHIAQLGKGSPSGAEKITFTFQTMLYHLTWAWLETGE